MVSSACPEPVLPVLNLAQVPVFAADEPPVFPVPAAAVLPELPPVVLAVVDTLCVWAPALLVSGFIALDTSGVE